MRARVRFRGRAANMAVFRQPLSNHLFVTLPSAGFVGLIGLIAARASGSTLRRFMLQFCFSYGEPEALKIKILEGNIQNLLCQSLLVNLRLILKLLQLLAPDRHPRMIDALRKIIDGAIGIAFARLAIWLYSPAINRELA